MSRDLVFEKTLYSSILVSIHAPSVSKRSIVSQIGRSLTGGTSTPGVGRGGGALEESLGRGVPPTCHTFVEGPVKYFAIEVNDFGIR